MKKKDILFSIALIVISLLFSVLARSLLNWKLNTIYGFHITAFAILGSLVYIITKYFRFQDTLIIVFFSSILNSIILKRTMIVIQIGGFFRLILYSLFIFFSYAVIFKITWFKFRNYYLRNLLVSFLNSVSYTIINLVVLILIKEDIDGKLILNYLINAFIMMLVIHFSFSLAEAFFYKIEEMLKMPERRKQDDKDI